MSDNEEEGVVRTTSAEVRDTILRKHSSRIDAGKTRKKRGRRRRKPEAEPEPAPTAADAESGAGDKPPETPRLPFVTEPPDDPLEPVYTALDPVPDEDDPYKRDGPTYGPIEETYPDLSGGDKQPLRDLDDICRRFRIGRDDSACYISVERVEPKTQQGINMRGKLGHVRAPMSAGEFKRTVGGGKYLLVVYGPDPKGRQNPHTGAPLIKALTKEIEVTHPGEAIFVDLDDDPDRRRDVMHDSWDPFDRRRRGIAPSAAEASMHRDSLKFAQDMFTEEREEKRRLEQKMESKPAFDGTVIEAVKESARAGIDAIRETTKTRDEMTREEIAQKNRQIEKLEQELKELSHRFNERPKEDNGAWKAMESIVQNAFRRPDDGGAVERLYKESERQISSLIDRHRDELASLRTAYEERLTAKDREAERERERFRDRERELKEDADRRERVAREEARAREEQLAQRYKEQSDQLKERHDRELADAKARHADMLEMQKQGYELRLGQADDRIKAAEKEAGRAREEAEKKEDFFGQMEKFHAQAELLGYAKSGAEENPPKTWQERLVAAFQQAVENAPQLLDAAGRTLKTRADAFAQQTQAMRQMQQGAAGRALPPGAAAQAGRPIRGPGGAPMGVRRPVWASEDGQPFEQPLAPEPPRAEPPPPRGYKPPEVRPEQQSAPPGNGASGPATPAEPARPPAGQPMAVSPEQLSQLRMVLEQNLANGADPLAYARALYEQLGPDQIRAIVGSLSADMVLEALSDDPAAADSPLLGRDGRGWFRRLWQEGRRLSGLSEQEASAE